jgi:16S rRNA (uracil1498-N3)-methyltransferase
MQRFHFADLESDTNNVIVQNKVFINQLTKVLRVSPWFQLILFSGEDNIDQIYEVTSVDKREISLKRVGHLEIDSEIDFELNIVQAFPNKIEKIEYVVQKWTEIGVSGFYFFRSERSQKLNLSDNKIERLQRIITEAAEQSGRSVIPKLVIEESLSLDACKENENILFHQIYSDDAQKLKDIELDYEKWVNIFVWPEWWFSEGEVELFEKSAFKKVYLWDRILRTETAWVVSSFFLIQNQ